MNLFYVGFCLTLGVIAAAALALALSRSITWIVGKVCDACDWWRTRRDRAWRRYPEWLRGALTYGSHRIAGEIGSVQPTASDPFGQGGATIPVPTRTKADIRSLIRDPHLMLPGNPSGDLKPFRPRSDIRINWMKNERTNEIDVWFE